MSRDMLSPSIFELTLACAAIGLIQLGVAGWFLNRLRAARLARGTGFAPPVSVIVPCKDAGEGLSASLLALAGQDYPGRFELVFVAAGEDSAAPQRPSEAALPRDNARSAAAAEVRRAIARLPVKARLVISGARPEAASEKCLNLAAGAAAAAPDSEVLAFADSDLLMPRSWLASMVEPLADERAGLVTSGMLHAPAGLDAWSFLRQLWTANGIPYLALTGTPAGSSMAMRRRDFDAMAVARTWSRSLNDDLSLIPLVRAAGLSVRFAAGAMRWSNEARGPGRPFAALDRWIAMLRLDAPGVWVPGLMLTAFKTYALCRALWPPSSLGLAAAFWLADALPLALLVAGYSRLMPEAFQAAARPRVPAWLLAGLCAPLVHLMNVRHFAFSLVAREVAWAGFTYRLLGPGRVEAAAGEEAAGLALRSRLIAMALACCAGLMTGLALMPGAWGALAWIGFVPLFFALRGRGPSEAFWLGLLSGCVCSLAQGWWLLPSLIAGRRLSLSATVERFAFLVVVHGLKYGLACLAAAWASAAGRAWATGPRPQAADTPPAGVPGRESAGPLAIGLFLALIAADGWFPMLFPARLANTQASWLAAIQSAELLGQAGLAWLICGTNAAGFLLAEALLRGRRPSRTAWAAAAAACAAVGANTLWGAARVRAVDREVSAAFAGGRTLTVALLQGNMPADRRVGPGRFGQDLPLYNGMTREALSQGPVDLVVWPESTYAGLIEYGAGWAEGAGAGGGTGGAAVAGVPLAAAMRDIPHRVPMLFNAIGRGADGRHRNISVLTGPDRTPLGIAEKRHLAPLGEFMPLSWLFPFVHKVNPWAGRLSPASRQALLVLPGKAKLGALVCYEDLLPDYARAYASMGADLLVNQTNDSFFKRTLALELHLRMAVMSAVESRRFLARAVNAGVTSVVDPAGRVIRRVPPWTRGVAVEKVALMAGPPAGAASRRLLYPLAALALAAMCAAYPFRTRENLGA